MGKSHLRPENLSQQSHTQLRRGRGVGGPLGPPFGTSHVQAPPLGPRIDEQQDPTLDAPPVRQQKPSQPHVSLPTQGGPALHLLAMFPEQGPSDP